VARADRTAFEFITEASLNLADDTELMQLMKDAGFKSVFLALKRRTSRPDFEQQATEYAA